MGRLPGLGVSQGPQRPLCSGQMAAGSGGRGCQARWSVSWPRFYTLPLPGPGLQVPFAEWVNEGAFFEIHLTSPLHQLP